MQQDPIKVTTTQNKYLLQLETGPMTTNDLMRALMVSMGAAARMIHNLKKKDLVESMPLRTKGNVSIHKLVTPYQELIKRGLIITTKTKGKPIAEGEILYAAILRNGMMTGQELTTQYNKVFPDRVKNGVSNVVDKARKEGLCR